MIYANELTYGDIVKLGDNIVKVCSVTRKKIGFHLPGDTECSNLHYAALSKVEPVWITKKILENNDWKRIHVDEDMELWARDINVYSDHYTIVSISFYKTPLDPYGECSLNLKIQDEDDIHPSFDYPVQYVHKLQSAMRNTGLREWSNLNVNN